MGGFRQDVEIPHVYVMHFEITIKGKWMYRRDDIPALITMVERGVLGGAEEDGCKVIGKFALEDWKDAWDLAAEKSGLGESVVIAP